MKLSKPAEKMVKERRNQTQMNKPTNVFLKLLCIHRSILQYVRNYLIPGCVFFWEELLASALNQNPIPGSSWFLLVWPWLSVLGRSKPDSSCLRTKKVTKAYFAVVDLCTEPEQCQDMICHSYQKHQNSHIQVILTF